MESVNVYFQAWKSQGEEKKKTPMFLEKSFTLNFK